MRMGALLAALLAIAACTSRATPPPPHLEIESDEVEAHRLSAIAPIRDPAPRDQAELIPMRIVVGADGRVTDARIETNARLGDRSFSEAVAMRAAAEARSWRFRPFTRGGTTIPVTFVMTINLYPPEVRAAQHVPMPPFDGRFRIVLERTGCYGTCPAYRVEITADGAVTFRGEHDVFAPGLHRGRIDPAAVRRLYDLAQRADFFSLRDRYSREVTDNPTYVVTVLAGDQRKRVVDYSGEAVGMPSIVRTLEDEIDRAAGTQRWIEGDETLIPAIAAEGFDFRSFEGARMLATAAAAGNARLVAALLGSGAPLTAAPPSGSLHDAVAALPAAARAGQTEIVRLLLSRRTTWSRSDLREALDAATAGGSYESFDLLAARGALEGIDRARANRLLRDAAKSGDTRLTARALALNPDVNRVDRNYAQSPVLNEAARVTCPWNRLPPRCDPSGVVAMLLRAGANPRLANPVSPESPLSFVSDVRIAQQLLAAGADPNFPDFDGTPPIFSTGYEDVALALLDAGANPRARRPGDGMTVAGWARYQQWPRVLARFRAQGAMR